MHCGYPGGRAEHTDINLLTLIPVATAPGLQIFNNDTWVDVPFDEKYIIVNSGDMLSECTEGYLKSTVHRVLGYSNVSRILTPFLCIRMMMSYYHHVTLQKHIEMNDLE